ncbi:MAG: hypothetical protein AUJ92_13435 [Armatimonadetes bacterium CG2_30_59_28]|nr:phosphoribosylanthranilate isomerase [Armatimonadota bacterium]OIO92827.1 MAG: hypothetical protein AUJ92_13435 [Armatimonadetes bacterium CG2_30_59_28]PIU66169.1 MAG: N-(5'-phosphoribosyl)anthranilate isomerase [Armatimonadetes bacterium CG07_land_8_20_14_0_80_59_28]PIX41687.1 MAG: N-(5'-phosphoribosyl)anthranilate isomerase [Armatimonadetes bacterium CG_4_8_14_3_um_filter_58_9]PIY37725.1 MAG: N-(5'-phosphoribosyl)anthranilate isomerase [Armatimonadetes bacterium CG_4_10_14_3_um_filter_59_1
MNSPTRTKICGITRPEDAAAATEAGADYLGAIIKFPPSPRSLEATEARRVFANCPTLVVAVTVNLDNDALRSIVDTIGPGVVQLHGDEDIRQIADLRGCVSCEIWKTLHIRVDTSISEQEAVSLLQTAKGFAAAGVDKILLDAKMGTGSDARLGGTGRTVDWSLAARLVASSPCPAILGGGLNPINIGDAMRQVRPFAVDVSSGVESAPGRKDHAKIIEFIQTVRGRASSEESP